MKKFIALGVGVLSAASLVIGASPVKASPADPIINEAFCLSLGVTTNTSQVSLDSANSLLAVANGDVDAKREILRLAVIEWVQAFGQHLVALDTAGANTTASQAVLDAAAAEVTKAVGPWGQAKLDQWTAQHNADIADIAHLMNVTLQGEVCAV